MNYIKSCLLICSLFVLSLENIWSQTSPTVIKPDVNSQQFISGMSSDNNLHTGQLSLSIPLFNLSAKGIDVPISLNFGTAGINYQSEASSVGLGWSLMAGGVITRTVKGTNDDEDSFLELNNIRNNDHYLEDKVFEQSQNPNSINTVEMAISSVMGERSLPDRLSYSFLGYAGDICINANGTKTLYPDMSFKMEATTNGYKVTDNSGVVYMFESKSLGGGYTVSWFLSEIKTTQGGVITFSYDDEVSSNASYFTSVGGGSSSSKRIKRIDYQYGYVLFNSASRSDRSNSGISPDAKRITGIEQYDSENHLIKGYQLDNSGYFVSENSSNVSSELAYRLRLNGLKSYDANGVFAPPTTFVYDYKFGLPKNSSIGCSFNCVKNTWASNPTPTAFVDRSYHSGEPTCRTMVIGDPYGTGTITVQAVDTAPQDLIDGYTINDFFCLKEVTYPSGGGETYYYEPHSYGKVGYSDDYNYFVTNYIRGKRLFRKVIWDKKDSTGSSPIEIEYKYILHDENYVPRENTSVFQGPPPSSGVLSAPTIYTSIKYDDCVFNNSFVGDKLKASLYQTLTPQNNEPESVVYYTEVEEIFKSSTGTNGKNIYYYDKVVAVPAQNYFYSNYNSGMFSDSHLVNLPNTLRGKPTFSGEGCVNNSYLTFLSYPVGDFLIYDIMKGKITKEVSLDSNNKIVSKTENEYTPYNTYQYGLNVVRFDKGYIGGDYNKKAHIYLISKSASLLGTALLNKKITTKYYPRSGGQLDSLATGQHFNFIAPNLLASSSIKQSNGKEIITENVFPQSIQFQTTSNLNSQASTLKQMKDQNMYVPVQTTVKNGTEYVGGSYKTFKTLPGGAVAVDTENSLIPQRGIAISNPYVNTSGTVVQNTGLKLETTYLSYDQSANPTTILSKGNVTDALYWGHGGQYVTTRIQNYSQTQLDNNSILKQQLNQLDSYRIIDDSNRAAFITCNQAIRNSLPANTLTTTYTYRPLVGVSSITDPKGNTVYYEYDSFNRLKQVKDQDGKILSANEYHYKGQ